LSLDNYANCNTDANGYDDQELCNNCGKEYYLHDDDKCEFVPVGDITDYDSLADERLLN